MIQVLALKRRGVENARDESWWTLLQAGKDQALGFRAAALQERRKALNDWMSTLSQVHALARKARGCLLRESKEMMRQAHAEVKQKLLPSRGAAPGIRRLPAALQSALGVHTQQEIDLSVQAYEQALSESQQLHRDYEQGAFTR